MPSLNRIVSLHMPYSAGKCQRGPQLTIHVRCPFTGDASIAKSHSRAHAHADVASATKASPSLTRTAQPPRPNTGFAPPTPSEAALTREPPVPQILRPPFRRSPKPGQNATHPPSRVRAAEPLVLAMPLPRRVDLPVSGKLLRARPPLRSRTVTAEAPPVQPAPPGFQPAFPAPALAQAPPAAPRPQPRDACVSRFTGTGASTPGAGSSAPGSVTVAVSAET